MAASSQLVVPIPTQLPELKPDTYFSRAQWQILLALVDAVVPSIVADSDITDQKLHVQVPQSQLEESYKRIKNSMKHPPNYEKFQQYLQSRPLDNPRFLQAVKRILENIPDGNRKQLGAVLNLMATRLGSLAATGYYTPLHEQPIHIRESVIQAWNHSWMTVWPLIGNSITKIAKVCFAQTDTLFLELSSYTEISDDYKPGPSFDFDFMQFKAGSEIETVDTDVAIVGSGCGGAVCAKVLSEAGHKVIVVDKGYYFPPSKLPMATEAGLKFLYEGSGSMQTVDGSTTILAGSCWGGGGTVNWSVSLNLQGFVRQEWANQGLDFFTTQEFQSCIDRVCDYMGVSDAYIRHNHGANVILSGSKKLGWTAKSCPQNTGGAEHYCGHCATGCGSGEKKGPSVSWLPAAARAGAKFIEGFNATKVLFDENRGLKTAVGVLGTWTSRDKDGNVHTPASERIQRQVRIRARKVIVSCGTLNSPLLLMRSGLRNPHIGKHLYLHPVCQMNASFDEDIKGWEGGILTSVCSSFENLDGKGHGAKLEPTSMIPYMFLHGHPWQNALQWKLDALRARQMNSYISMARDRDTGRVYPDPNDGRPTVEYSPSAFDRKHILTGIIALSKLCYIEGATEIWPFVKSIPSFVRRSEPTNPSTTTTPDEGEDHIDQGINDPDFVAWLKNLERVGLNYPDAVFASAHQMGTCRMSAHPARGVVDPEGRVWEARGLYVADASVFPTASGVNPMITNMAIADWIARRLSKDLVREEYIRAAL
ncbi:long-chain fatty alcohol dehydrogenase [Daldinia bambusicola]|nr:long-chain fatty alcohol dehydrogenase [Daldinia bambusicola]